MASLIGYCLAFVDLGYVTLFYVLGWKVGVWAPQDIPYDESVSTVIPWIYPVLAGAFPAVDEEFTYRMFATSLLMLWVGRQFSHRRVSVLSSLGGFFKRPWFAIVLPATIWGFLHVGYPQEPFYIRGIEVSLTGILWGWVFIRYGIASTVVAHYTVNAVLSSTLLLRASHPYLMFSGILACAFMLLPVMPAAVVALWRKRLVSTEELWGLEEPVASTAEDVAASSALVSLPYRPLRYWQIALLLVMGINGWAAFHWVKPERFGDFMQMFANRKEAIEIADDFLRTKGVPVDRFMQVATFINWLGGDDADYIYEKEGFKALNRIFRDRLPQVFWSVRYFVPMRKEEYTVSVTSDGKVFTYGHTVEEDAAGANLSKEAAQRKAEAYLQERRVDLSDWELTAHSSEKRKKRTDHWFTWEDRETAIGDGTFSLSVRVQGDEVLDYRPWFRVPEEWERKRDERNVKDAVLGGVGSTIGMTLAILLLWLFIRTLASGQVNWRFALKMAGVMTAFLPLSWVNNLTTFWSAYDTTQPPVFFLALYGMGWTFGLLGGFVANFLLVAFAETLFRQTFPHLPPIPEWLNFRPFAIASPTPPPPNSENLQPPHHPTTQLFSHHSHPPSKHRLWRDALLIAFVLCAFSLGMESILSKAVEWEELFRHVGEVNAPPAEVAGGYTEWSPAVSAVEGLVYAVIYAGLGLAVAAALYRRYVKRRWLLYVLLLLLTLLAAGEEAKNWGEFGIMAAGIGVVLALMLWIGGWFLRTFLQTNLYAYLATFAVATLLNGAIEMLNIPDATVRTNGFIVLALLALLVLLVLGVAGKRRVPCVFNP